MPTLPDLPRIVNAGIRGPQPLDLTGRRFGRLVAVRYAGAGARGSLWECHCDCGRTVTAARKLLRNGHARSCGCLQAETRKSPKTHGLSRTPEYRVWQAMTTRCHNPNSAHYARYGGRGVRVCRRWRASFAAFYADMGPRPSPRHTLDRVRPAGPYSPSNCRWATPDRQRRNRRASRWLRFRGERLTVAEWSQRTGLRYGLILSRLDRLGWPVAKALTTPAPAGGGKVRRGLAGMPEYRILGNIRTRCTNPHSTAYRHYGGRGVVLCRGWQGAGAFPRFLAQLGRRPSPHHSVDRIDNRFGYCCGRCAECVTNGWPANCRWATAAEQARNTRRNVVLEHDGLSLCLEDWAERTGLRPQTIRDRIRLYGWDVARALTTPARAVNRR